jgi:hypothetical protein
MVVERAEAMRACPRCIADAPRLYGLPEKVLKSLAAPRGVLLLLRADGRDQAHASTGRRIAWPGLERPSWPHFARDRPWSIVGVDSHRRHRETARFGPVDHSLCGSPDAGGYVREGAAVAAPSLCHHIH